MKVVYEALCLENWYIEAENGDRQDCVKGKTYTISAPRKDGTVKVFSRFWVDAPAHIFERRSANRGLAGAACD